MPTGMTGSQWIVSGFTGTIGSITGTASSNVVADATVYSFTSGSGTFAVSAGAPVIVDYLVVGGGGGGGWNVGGGGGAGGLVYTKGVQLPVGAYTWTVGAGGAAASTAGAAIAGSSGANSSLSSTAFGNITALGGGGGGPQSGSGLTGGSAGGAGGNGTVAAVAGATGQGNSGGAMSATWSAYVGAGGGGAGNAGSQPSSTLVAGVGGSGLAIPITGSNVYYAGGGGGGNINANTPASGGLGGGGAGGAQSGTSGTTTKTDAVAGTANTGGGGGGAGAGGGTAGTALPSAGGSGVVILRVYTNIGSRLLIGDGSGYSMALSAQSNAVTRDVMTVTDQGNVSIGLSNASFNGCHDAKFDSLGNMYVTDYANHRIRKITPAGVVTTFLGNGSTTTLGGTGTGASISLPFGLAIGVMSGIETLFATSANNTVVAAPLSTGVMTIIAGSNGVSASTDSTTGTAARFNSPFSLALDTTNSYVFVVDVGNDRIRRIAYTGTYAVTTLGSAGFVASATPLTLTGTSVRGLVYDGTTSNFYYTTNTAYGKIALTSGGNVATNTSNASGFTYASGITFNSNKTGVYFVDFGLHQVFSAGLGVAAAVAIAGTSGVAGSIDATGLNATLNGPRSLTIDPAGSNLYIGDYGDSKIRKVNIATSNVTTYAGTGVAGFADGSVPTTTVVNNTLLGSNINGVSGNLVLNQYGGNVGIGNNAPVYTLDVSGNTAATGSIIGGNGYLGNLSVNTATTFPILGFNASNQAGIYGRKGTNNNYSGLDFVSMINQVATTVMTVSPNAAAVGINCNAPVYTLDVSGSINASTFTANTGNARMRQFGSYYGSAPYNSDYFITNNIASFTSNSSNILTVTPDSTSYGTAAIRIITNQVTPAAVSFHIGGTSGAVPVTVASITPSGLTVTGGLYVPVNAPWVVSNNAGTASNSFLYPRFTDDAMYIDAGTGNTAGSNVGLYIRVGSTGPTPTVNTSARFYSNLTIGFSGYTANGTLTTTGGTGLLAVTSDKRVKTNIQYITDDATSKIMALKPCRFELIADPSNTQLGFIAQDVETVIPEAIDGKKYEYEWQRDGRGNTVVDSNGQMIMTDKPRYRGFSDRPLIAMLVKAFQELSARLSNVEAKLAAATTV